jgi:hypothetical protein
MKKLIYLTLMLAGSFWMLGCASEDSAAPIGEAASDVGVAGSYSRFIIVGSYMYAVDNENLRTIDLSTASDPEWMDEQFIGSNIESIFSFQDKLFIGAVSGLYIYQIGADGVPVQTAEYPYSNFGWGFEPCDPVVANDSFAYVTINTTTRVTRCRITSEFNVNLLLIYNITDIYDPVLVAQYDLFNPKGVGLDGTTLFVCDGEQGLKIFDVSNPQSIEELAHFDGFEAFDVIPLGGLLLVVGPDNVYQFDYSDLENIRQISEIPFGV